MANPSARTLQLLSLLQKVPHWRGADLAERLEVSERTLRRDVDRLRELGYPVEATPGVDGGYRLAAGTVLPPLSLDDDEAVAIVVGLQSGALSGVSGVAESATRTLAKLVPVLPARVRRRADALRAVTDAAAWRNPSSGVDADTLIALAEATRANERVEFAHRAADGTTSDRLVEPHRLVMLGSRWYLLAWDAHRHAWRTFRVDRIAQVRRSGQRFAPRRVPAKDALTFVRASLDSMPSTHEIEAVVHAPIDALRTKVGRWGRLEALDDDTTRLVIASDSYAWPAMLLGSLDAEFTVVSPKEFAHELRTWSKRFDRATRT